MEIMGRPYMPNGFSKQWKERRLGKFSLDIDILNYQRFSPWIKILERFESSSLTTH